MTEAIKGHLAMLAFSGLIAGSFAPGAMAANQIAPIALNAQRFALVSVLFSAWAFGLAGVPRSAARAPWRYVLMGVAMAAYFVLMF